MWHKQIHFQLGQDILPLRRQGLSFTWKTLDVLRRRLLRAALYTCPSPEELAPAPCPDPDNGASQDPSQEQTACQDTAGQTDAGSSENATVTAAAGEKEGSVLFDAEGRLVPLPQENMLFEWEDDTRRAVLLCGREHCVEMYVFHFSSKFDRWRWPLMGMSYGPTLHDIVRIAVFEPSELAKRPPQAQRAMLEDHVKASATAFFCLRLVQEGRLVAANADSLAASPAQGKKKAQEKPELPVPSSLARAGRTRHEKGGMGKGAHRM